ELDVDAVDPDGDTLSYTWTTDCAQLTFDFLPPYDVTRPHLSMPGPSDACSVTVAVSDAPDFAGTLGTLQLPPNTLSDRCRTVTCESGQVCDEIDGVCKPALCLGVTCNASDLCHVAGACVPATGACSAETPKSCPVGQACDLADGQCKASGNLCANVTCTA